MRNKFLEKRFSKLTIHQELKAQNVYPYFKEISSINPNFSRMEGQNILMFGSNSYLGLGNHPKVKQAAQLAIDKYGTTCSGSRF